MTTAFGFFKKIDGTDRYTLTSVVTSSYETERQDDSTMVRDIAPFHPNMPPGTDILTLMDNSRTNLFSFGADNSVTIHPDISEVTLYRGQDLDQEYGMNRVIVKINNKETELSFHEPAGVYFRGLFPEGYSEGGE